MVDIETLGVETNSVVLTIGAVVFDPRSNKTGKEFYVKIKLEDYAKYPQFGIDYSTLTWWITQTESAREEAFLGNDRVSVKIALTRFKQFLPSGRLFMWSHGKEFDLPILKFAMETVGLECPWKFWDTRDTRTVYDVCGVNLKTIPFDKHFAHHALGDCLRQIKGVQLAYSEQ